MILPTRSAKKSIIVFTNLYTRLFLLFIWNLMKLIIISLLQANSSLKWFSRKDFKFNLKASNLHKTMTSTNPKSTNLINREDVNEMIENAIRRHNRRSTIISAILGWILIGGYSFGLFHVVQNIWLITIIQIYRRDDFLFG